MFNRGYDCAMIWHTQLFLWSMYSYTMSLLIITVRGYRINIAYCLFSFKLILLALLLRYFTYTPNGYIVPAEGLVSIRGFSWDLNILIIFWAQIAT